MTWDRGARLKLTVTGVRPLVAHGRKVWALETTGQDNNAIGVWS